MCDFITPVLLADTPDMSVSYVAAVVITGLVVVFLALLLLIFFFILLGKIFGEKKKKPQTKVEEAKPVVTETKVEMTVAQEAPVIEDGIEEEVVAVITAAIAAMSAQTGKKMKLVGIRTTSRNVRPAWAQAGLVDNTRPF